MHNFPPHLTCVATLPENTLPTNRHVVFLWKYCKISLLLPLCLNFISVLIISIDKLHVLQIFLLVFKCLYHSDLVPSIYSNYFVLNNEIHNYNRPTRLSQGLHICVPRTSFGQKCIQFKGSSIWNSLPS